MDDITPAEEAHEWAKHVRELSELLPDICRMNRQQQDVLIMHFKNHFKVSVGDWNSKKKKKLEIKRKQ